ncbi:MAG TPA: serine protease [Dongiaceae bacterium]|nr:serine protease [Dongiaceae bacterium]
MTRKLLFALTVLSFTPCNAPSQQSHSGTSSLNTPPAPDFDKTVLKVSELKFNSSGLQIEYGTAFCLDPACRFLCTNYHVEAMAKPHKIAGDRIIETRLATGPHDKEAATVPFANGSSLRFNYSRDLALFELKYPLRGHRGAEFTLDPPEPGQPVDIYVYPLEGVWHDRRLLKFNGRFVGEAASGLFAFEYESIEGHKIRPGSSGGIVVDRRSQRIVGVVSAIADYEQWMVFAVPAQSLFDFVSRVHPELARLLFPPAQTPQPSIAMDLYPQISPSSQEHALQFRSQEPPAITVLRGKAQQLANSIQNFVAVQTIEWGSQAKPVAASAAYEIRVIDGYQKFRKYPEGTQDLRDIPFPPLNTTIVPGGEWSELPQLIAGNPRVAIEAMPDSIVEGQSLKVFRYRGSVEDDVCHWRSSLDLGFFSVNKDVNVECYGEVWTDQDGNILHMSERYDLPGNWKNYEAVMTYGWLERQGDSRRLVPLSMKTQAEFKGKVYWCRSNFLNYRVFASQVRMTSSRADIDRH